MQQLQWNHKSVMVLATRALLIAVTTTEVSCWKYLHFVNKPNTTIYSDIGQNVSMKWSFKVDENRPYKEEGVPYEVLFGVWNYPGYIKPSMIRIEGSTIKTMSNKSHWKGNISNLCSDCEGEITLFNLTSGDFKTYGIFIFAHPHLVSLQQKLRVVRHTDAEGTVSTNLRPTEFETLLSKGISTRGLSIKFAYPLMIGCYTITNIYSHLT